MSLFQDFKIYGFSQNCARPDPQWQNMLRALQKGFRIPGMFSLKET